jgi:hypothetical protein
VVGTVAYMSPEQAQGVALEDEKLGHGLLTYALLHDGLMDGKSDWEPQGGEIHLREWLRYGVERVPILWSAIQSGSFGKGVLL